MSKFSHLPVPQQWKESFTKYPHGLTIFEALCNWTKQVDSMVDNINNWNEYLEGFVKSFDINVREEVTLLLNDWKESGLLEAILSEGMENEFTMFKDIVTVDIGNINNAISELLVETETIGVDINSINQELGVNSKKLSNIHIDVTQPPWNVPNNGTDDATDTIQNVLDNAPIRSVIYLPRGKYKITKPLILQRELVIRGSHVGENGGTVLEFDMIEKPDDVYGIELKSTAKNSTIENLYLKNITTDYSGFYGIGNREEDNSITHLNVSDVWSVGFTVGFLFYKIYLSRFYRCYAVNNFTGFQFMGFATSLIFEGCYSNKNTDNYNINNVIYSTFIACASDGASRYGYTFGGCKALSLQGCGVEFAQRTGLFGKDNSGISIDGFFAHGCGEATGSWGASVHIENGNKGVVINGLHEESVHQGTTRTSSVVYGSVEGGSITGADVKLKISAPAVVLVDGQRRANSQPSIGTYKSGDFVYSNNPTSILGWVCVSGGTPGTWREVTI